MDFEGPDTPCPLYIVATFAFPIAYHQNKLFNFWLIYAQPDVRQGWLSRFMGMTKNRPPTKRSEDGGRKPGGRAALGMLSHSREHDRLSARVRTYIRHASG